MFENSGVDPNVRHKSIKSILTNSNIFSSSSLFNCLRGVIPRSLPLIFNNKGISKSSTSSLLMRAYHFLFDQLKTRIWNVRCRVHNDTLNSVGITKRIRKKRFFSKNDTSNRISLNYSASYAPPAVVFWKSWISIMIIQGSAWESFISVS